MSVQQGKPSNAATLFCKQSASDHTLKEIAKRKSLVVGAKIEREEEDQFHILNRSNKNCDNGFIRWMISIFRFLSNFSQEGQDPNLLEATRFSHDLYEKFLKIYIFFYLRKRTFVSQKRPQQLRVKNQNTLLRVSR